MLQHLHKISDENKRRLQEQMDLNTNVIHRCMDVTEATRDQMTRQRGTCMLLKDEDKISASMVSALKEAKETLPHMVKITEILFDKEGIPFQRSLIFLTRHFRQNTYIVANKQRRIVFF